MSDILFVKGQVGQCDIFQDCLNLVRPYFVFIQSLPSFFHDHPDPSTSLNNVNEIADELTLEFIHVIHFRNHLLLF